MTLYEELSNLDVNDFNSWSQRIKLFMTAMLGVLVLFGGWNFVIRGAVTDLTVVKRQETTLKNEFLEKKALAINLDAYKQQMVEAEATFGVLLKQLPNASEIPDLLIDMTQAGLSRGLQFEQIKPGETIEKGFYAEKLVNIKVNGSYHQIAGFISDIAALPRIINVSNFELNRQTEDSNLLTLNAVTQTYHYIDDSNDAATGVAP